MTFKDFSEINKLRCESVDGFNHRLDSWTLSDWFTAFIGEAGEAANVVKKLNRYRDGVIGNNKTEDELRAQLKSEIADSFIYLDLLAQAAGFSIEDAVVETFNKKSDKIGSPIKIYQIATDGGDNK